MFVSLRRTPTWRLNTMLYKFWSHTSKNNARMKNSRDLILGEAVYVWIIYRNPDSWLNSLNGYDFYFWSQTGENREYGYGLHFDPSTVPLLWRLPVYLAVRRCTVFLLCFLIVDVYASGSSIPLSLLMLLGWSLMPRQYVFSVCTSRPHVNGVLRPQVRRCLKIALQTADF